jgi:hypothetical protein
MIRYVLSHDFLASSSCLQHASWTWCDRVIERRVGVASEVCLFMSELADLLCDSFHRKLRGLLVVKTEFSDFGGLCQKLTPHSYSLRFLS